MLDKKRKIKYDCKTDGVVFAGTDGVMGICPVSIVGGGCGAHGNTKCINKVIKSADNGNK